MTILVSGGAGFIGSHLCRKLIHQGHTLYIIDNFDPFYSSSIKEKNIEDFLGHQQLTLIRADITDNNIFKQLNGQNFDLIIHLAAKAGVRPSILQAQEYEKVNVRGTLNLLEFAKDEKIPKFIFASSSSVYGINPTYPWSEANTELMPISPYASTKLSAEFLGYTYSHLYDIEFTALRFFTVYGPGQRPDLAIHKFFKALYTQQPIDVYGDGSTMRDYTFVEDIVSGIEGSINFKGEKKFNIFNLGGNEPIKLIDLVRTIEQVCNRTFDIRFKEMQPGDVPITYADISKASAYLGYKPSTTLEEGLKKFRSWYESTQLD